MGSQNVMGSGYGSNISGMLLDTCSMLHLYKIENSNNNCSIILRHLASIIPHFNVVLAW